MWTPTGNPGLTSRAVLQAINLHFRDLRHEAGSRWLEAGMPLHHVEDRLGHAKRARLTLT
ncbi:MAG: tyrosine-type recombinase/integrase [Acidobacteriota bacterium]